MESEKCDCEGGVKLIVDKILIFVFISVLGHLNIHDREQGIYNSRFILFFFFFNKNEMIYLST